MVDIRAQVEEGQKKWARGINMQSDDTDITDIDDFVKFKTLEYEDANLKDDELWGLYQDDFKDFTVEIFKNCNQTHVRKLRTILRTNGVWVQKHKNTTVPESMFNTIQEEDPTDWTISEINEHMAAGGKFNSGRIEYILKNNTTNKDSTTTTTSTSSTDPSTQTTLQTETTETEIETTPQVQQAHPQAQNNSTTQGFGRELANLAKMYTEDNKYSGENDNFDFKLVIFHDLCNRADIPQEVRIRAYPTMLRSLALDHYYTSLKNVAQTLSLDQICNATRQYFEGPEYRRGILGQWNSITLKSVMGKSENTSKSTTDCLQLLIKELRHLQHGLDPDLRTDKFLHNKIINACQELPACQYACFKPSDSLAGLINDLRSSITTFEKSQSTGENINTQAFFTDRRYHRQHPRPYTNSRYQRSSNKKRCFVCNKEDCWSSKHTREEREESKRKFKEKFNQRLDKHTRQYIAEYEGIDYDDELESTDNEFEALIIDIDSTLAPLNQEQPELFLTSFGTIQHTGAINAAADLADRSFTHAITSTNPTIACNSNDSDPFAYNTNSRYTSDEFYGIMIDTGASRKSTAGYGQYLAYRKTRGTTIDTLKAGAINVQFGIGSTPSIGSITISTPIGNVEFHIVQADTPFLLCLADMDILKVFYNNLDNVLITPNKSIPVIRRFGHPFLLWEESLQSFIANSFNQNPCYLTTTELRQLHRRFGHPSANRLYRVLERSGHDTDKQAIEYLTKYCSFCQKHSKSPGRFKFTLREDQDSDFNHSIFVDIMYINGDPVLHIIDEATRFQAARWLRNISAKHTWDTLRLCWIDSYLGPPDYITHDAGKNFVSKEFRQYAISMAISTKSVPVEAHWSIGIVERAHPVLRRAYQIIMEELQDLGITKEQALQMAVKAVNDTAGPDGLVPTLLVFGAYPRMSELDPPAPSITQRATAIKRAMEEVSKIRAQKQVDDALNQRNGPSVTAIHDLPINSDVLVWREGNTGQSGKWTGPFKLLGTDRETCKVQLPSGPTDFRTTTVKPYLQPKPEQPATERSEGQDMEQSEEQNEEQTRRNAERTRRLPARYRQNTADISVFIQDDTLPSFTESRRKEINGLLEKGVFETVNITNVPEGVRIFNSRFVDEIKNAGTDKAFEKSRLVVQAYNDQGKDLILTQSPTIQRVSQRIILALAPTLQAKRSVSLYLRDISQAYVQSSTHLNRDFFIRPPPELGLQEGLILKVIKPLYSVPEAGNHWFNTYHRHHLDKLRMDQSTYDPCLLYTNRNGFGIVGLQTDDTLFLADETFAESEETKLREANFLAKEREKLTQTTPIKFNGGHIKQEKDSIILTQERQCQNLKLVTTNPIDLTSSRGEIRKTVAPKDQYVAQRARGAYIATVCQPEAAFDLSFAAQTVNPGKEHTKQLNKRLQWQIDNPSRGLRFVQLDLDSLRLIIFTDSSFANNHDLSSQIGFVIVLADKDDNANILHWSSIKCKRVTRSVLASELYGMVHGFDTGAAIKSTIENILQLEQLPITLCTDSKSLYDCLVKLGTTQEKRLMVDLMCLRQSYERREITEVKWIEGDTNPADAMTKTKPCQALRDLIDTNKVNLRATEWVERVGVVETRTEATSKPQNKMPPVSDQ